LTGSNKSKQLQVSLSKTLIKCQIMRLKGSCAFYLTLELNFLRSRIPNFLDILTHTTLNPLGSACQNLTFHFFVGQTERFHFPMVDLLHPLNRRTLYRQNPPLNRQHLSLNRRTFERQSPPVNRQNPPLNRQTLDRQNPPLNRRAFDRQSPPLNLRTLCRHPRAPGLDLLVPLGRIITKGNFMFIQILFTLQDRLLLLLHQ
jgi:hypothetical protein